MGGCGLGDTLMPLLSFNRARQRDSSDYAILWEGRRHPKITAFALDAAGYFQQATQGLSGVTCFSATLHPLPEMRLLSPCRRRFRRSTCKSAKWT